MDRPCIPAFYRDKLQNKYIVEKKGKDKTRKENESMPWPKGEAGEYVLLVGEELDYGKPAIEPRHCRGELSLRREMEKMVREKER